VHNGRFHEVGCDIQDFKRQPEAVRRTHTHHHSGAYERGAQAVLDFVKAGLQGGARRKFSGGAWHGAETCCSLQRNWAQKGLGRRKFSRRRRGRQAELQRWEEDLQRQVITEGAWDKKAKRTVQAWLAKEGRAAQMFEVSTSDTMAARIIRHRMEFVGPECDR